MHLRTPLIWLSFALVATACAQSGDLEIYDWSFKKVNGVLVDRPAAELIKDVTGLTDDRLQERLSKALIAWSRARLEGDPKTMSLAANALGSTYSKLGDYRRARAMYERALDLDPSDDRRAATYNNLAIVCKESGLFEDALRFATLSLQFRDRVATKDPNGALKGYGSTYNQLGNAHKELGHLEEALACYRRSLEYRLRAGVAPQGTMQNIGDTLVALGRLDEGRQILHESLALHRRDEERLEEARTLTSLGLSFKESNPQAAVVLLKEAVTIIQSAKLEFAQLTPDLQASFSESNSEPYRELAAILISLNRVQEAMRVLDMLKLQQASDYVRGGDDRASPPIDRVGAEVEQWDAWLKAQAGIGDKLFRLYELRGKERTPQEETEFDRLSADLAPAWQAIQRLYDSMQRDVARSKGATAPVVPLTDLQGIVARLSQPDKAGEPSKPVAAIRVFAIRDRVITLLVTPTGTQMFGHDKPIKEWKALLGNLGTSLRFPSIDPRGFGQEVYNLAFRDADRELRARKIDRVLCSMEGELRYVPVAAIWTGSGYMGDRYSISYFVPGAPLERRLRSEWRVAGFAMSKGAKTQEGGELPPLTGASREVDSIVRDSGEASGLLPGRQFLDEQFTPKSLRGVLENRREQVVHLATHFILKPKIEESYLVAGDSTDLSLRALQSWTVGQPLFQDVDLLYLSACDTGGIAEEGQVLGDGREIDTFAMFAMAENQAATVVSSLWLLDDEAASRFAEAFYRLRQEHPTESLGRLAQLAQHEVRDGRLPPGRTRSEPTHGPPATMPAFKPDAAHPFEHPYYWAPIVIFGSFR